MHCNKGLTGMNLVLSIDEAGPSVGIFRADKEIERRESVDIGPEILRLREMKHGMQKQIGLDDQENVLKNLEKNP